jgi:hypothetical protein
VQFKVKVRGDAVRRSCTCTLLTVTCWFSGLLTVARQSLHEPLQSLSPGVCGTGVAVSVAPPPPPLLSCFGGCVGVAGGAVDGIIDGSSPPLPLPLPPLALCVRELRFASSSAAFASLNIPLIINAVSAPGEDAILSIARSTAVFPLLLTNPTNAPFVTNS